MGNWVVVEAALRWSLDTRNKALGYWKLRHGLEKGDVNFMGEVEIGFDEGQRDMYQQANFKACKDENQNRLYNLGRHILGLAPVAA